ncbi:MAG: acyclic terpene utilization AtuA family protein, partial [Pseudomonadota bacterium]
KARGLRVIANAGGVNPSACAAALRAEAQAQGVDLRIAVVTGDDLTDRAAEFAAAGITEMFTGAPFPEPGRIASINAYLGAFPIAAALDQGADIVVTGRCVDSAVTLAACIHSFGWRARDFDLLSAGSLAGHLLECGPQATGGNFTDWRMAGPLDAVGYPIAEIDAAGVTVISKPEGTSGVVSRLSVAEQLVYEIDDPARYLLPDVACDFSGVAIEEVGADRVRVSGAKGAPPSASYKVSATYADGWRGGALLQMDGLEARAKAEAFGDAALTRARHRLRAANAPDFDDVSVEVLGGDAAAAFSVAARHRSAEGVAALLKEITGLALATPPGLAIYSVAGRPKPSPVVRLFSFLTPKADVAIAIDLGGAPQPFRAPEVSETGAARAVVSEPEPFAATLGDEEMALTPLIDLAVARSGDKGDRANIGVIARRPEHLPTLWAALDEDLLRRVFGGFSPSAVRRYAMPGPGALNIVLDDALGGGGVASLRLDAQGKAFAQRLLATPIPVPRRLLADLTGDRA